MFDPELLAGETAAVTGASRGIGEAIARAFAAHGADVARAARSIDALEALAAELETQHGVAARAVETDVRNPEAVADFADGATALGDGSVEVLVANAGASFYAGVADLSDNAWGTILDINLNGTYRCCHAFTDALAAADVGRVITMSSVIGRDGRPERAHYGASKAGIELFTRTLAMEWADRNVRANCIRPGLVATPAVEENRGIAADDIDRRDVDRTLGDTDEIADLALFLASPGTSYETGQTYTAEGIPQGRP